MGSSVVVVDDDGDFDVDDDVAIVLGTWLALPFAESQYFVSVERPTPAATAARKVGERHSNSVVLVVVVVVVVVVDGVDLDSNLNVNVNSNSNSNADSNIDTGRIRSDNAALVTSSMRTTTMRPSSRVERKKATRGMPQRPRFWQPRMGVLPGMVDVYH